MSKNLTYGKETRQHILDGVDFLVDAVKVTLGPRGRNVAIGRRLLGLNPLVTKDGVTVANHVNPSDPRQQIGADLAREAANRCVHLTGDGTTTTSVLVQGMVHAGMNYIDQGVDPWSIKRGIDTASALIIEQLEFLAKPIDADQTFAIANISSNGDEAIAGMVCDAFKKVGITGAVTVEESNTVLTELAITSGIQFKSGEFLSTAFITDVERFEVVYEDCYILLFEGRIGTAKSIAPLLSQVAKTSKPLLIIAGEWEQDALSAMVINRVKNGWPIVAVKTGAYAERRKDLLRDIASLTGATAILDDSGTKIESANLTHLGQAKRIVVSDKDTTIVDGYGSVEALNGRIGEIRTKLETSEEGVAKLWLQHRLAQLTGGIAVIRVGGNTEVEMREKKDRFDDAVGATRAAIEKGFVPGGGLALLKAQSRVNHVYHGADAGHSIVSQACVEPLKQIAKNAGFDPQEVLVQTMGSKTYRLPDHSYGFNARSGEFVDLVKAGVIDPVKVVIESLRNAASCAGMILTTETLVTEREEDLRPR